MPDLVAITTAIQSLKTATDMAKGIRQSTASIEDATVKFQIAELTNALADLKMALADVKEENVGLKEKLAQMERHESFRGLLELRDNVYFPVSGEIVWRQLSCPVRDNYDGRLSGLTFYSFQPA